MWQLFRFLDPGIVRKIKSTATEARLRVYVYVHRFGQQHDKGNTTQLDCFLSLQTLPKKTLKHTHIVPKFWQRNMKDMLVPSSDGLLVPDSFSSLRQPLVTTSDTGLSHLFRGIFMFCDNLQRTH